MKTRWGPRATCSDGCDDRRCGNAIGDELQKEDSEGLRCQPGDVRMKSEFDANGTEVGHGDTEDGCETGQDIVGQEVIDCQNNIDTCEQVHDGLRIDVKNKC